MLVEIDWLDYGHKFGDRCGHQENADDVSEQCPVFLQWLDCVHQLLKQFPCLFEFNEAFLVGGPAALGSLSLLKTACIFFFCCCGILKASTHMVRLPFVSRSSWCSTHTLVFTAPSCATTPARGRQGTSTNAPALCGPCFAAETRTSRTFFTSPATIWYFPLVTATHTSIQ